MTRGIIDPPKLDDRSWQDLVNQAKALIPQYAPEWTDHNPSDLGITLIELFAWLVEQMIYRLNRVPEKNYIAFLNLLGITRDPPVPASTFLTYQAADKGIFAPKGTRAATRQTTVVEAPIVFETDEDLNILPTNLVSALLIQRNNNDNEYTCQDMTANFVTLSVTDSKQKRITMKPEQTVLLALGFDKAIADTASPQFLRLRFRFSKPIAKPLPINEQRLVRLVEAGMSLNTLRNKIAGPGSGDEKDKLLGFVGDFIALRNTFIQGGFVLSGDQVVQEKQARWAITLSAPLGQQQPLLPSFFEKKNDRWTYRAPNTSPVPLQGDNITSLEANLNTLADAQDLSSHTLSNAQQAALTLLQGILNFSQVKIQLKRIDPKQVIGWSIAKPSENQSSYWVEKTADRLTVYKEQAAVSWCYSSSANHNPFAWTGASSVNDGTNGMQQDGIVSVAVPNEAGWSRQKCSDWENVIDTPLDEKRGNCHWIGIKLTNKGPTDINICPEYILFNSVPATNALTMKEERLGVSNGQPFQRFQLQHGPLFRRDNASKPYPELTIKVGPNREAWTCSDIIPAGPGNFCRLDPVTGVLYFGNWVNGSGTGQSVGNGTIPPTGNEIFATYRYSAGGRQGNQPAGRLTVLYDPIPGITAVTNLLPATGGVDEEAVEETKLRAPELLKNRYRAVTLEDYEYLAREASTRVAKVCALPPLEPKNGEMPTSEGLNREPGHVNVMIVPQLIADEPLDEPMPMPSDALLEEVYTYLVQRRVLTTRLHVVPPKYLPIETRVVLTLWPEALPERTARESVVNELKGKIEQQIRHFLHPLVGGPEGKGWAFGQHLYLSDLLKVIQVDPKLGYVETIVAYNADVGPPSQNQTLVKAEDFQIVCSSEVHDINGDI